MLKIMKKAKKLLVMLFLFIILFETIQPVILAANETISGNGTDKFTARQYATRIRTTDEEHNTSDGIIARRLIKQGWNFNDGDGILAFCAQCRHTL